MLAYIGRYDNDPEAGRAAYRRLFTDPPPYVALDTETPTLKDTTVLVVAIATPENDTFVFDFTDPDIPWHLIMPSSVRKIWHNCTFDLSWEVLGQFGADIDNIEDTVILLRLLNLDVTLADAARYVGTSTWTVKELFTKYKAKSMRQLPWEAMARKCMQDARVTLLLYEKYKAQVNQEHYEVDRRISSMLLHMSHRGIKLDKPLVTEIEAELASEEAFYRSKCAEYGFNPLAPKQVGIALTKQGVFLPWKRGKTQPTVDKNVLNEADNGIATLTLLARKYNKLHGVIAPWVGKERVHSHFHLDSATTRITSEDEQLHNLPTGARVGDIIPKAGPIRRVLLPDADVFTRWDLSQIELRVLQHLSGDLAMLAALDNTKGGIHSVVQYDLSIYSRVMAKNLVFGGFCFGGSPETVMQYTGIKDPRLIAHYIDGLNKKFPVAARYIAQQKHDGSRDGYITTLYGRKLSLTHAAMQGDKHIENCAINYPIQGSAAEIFKRIMLAIIDDGVPIEDLILQSHDEELLNGHYDIPVAELEHIAEFRTPLEISYPERWQ